VSGREAAGGTVAKWWNRLRDKPGGRAMFSVMIGLIAPYTRTIGALVEELRPGYARWSMRDRWQVRNHLKSIHAIALVNLAEVTSGTAMLMSLPPTVRGIVTGISIEYVKKARGTLTAECACTVPDVKVETPLELLATITDRAGDVVARATITWLLRPLHG
jgi:acyl-coenzyme A thioesterase PaaI-like protein